MEINFAWGSGDFILSGFDKTKRFGPFSEENTLLRKLISFEPHGFPRTIETTDPHYEQIKTLLES